MALLGHHLPGGDLSWVSSEGRQPEKLVWGLIIPEVTWGTRLGGVLLKVTPTWCPLGVIALEVTSGTRLFEGGPHHSVPWVSSHWR